MQLKPAPRAIRSRMGVATCALLQTGAHAGGNDSAWEIDTAVLFYAEADGRVAALEPAIRASRQLNEDERISLRLIADALTGATPNGAHASRVAQTFTTPSGGSSYTIAAGENPLDDTFRDTRVAVGADWEIGLDRTSRLVLGANGSGEYDYFSLGLSASYMQDFNKRNTTLSAGLAFNNDTISPVAGVPSALRPMLAPGSVLRDGAEESKTIVDVIIGITQVVDSHTLLQANFSTGTTSGYQTDPYKIVAVVDPVTGLPDNTALLNVNAGALPYVYEKRPDSRQRNNLFLKGVHSFGEDVLHLSYRYYWDDWGINSHTLDMRYRYAMQRGYLQPHLRYYNQSEADFYRHHLVQGNDVDASGNVRVDYASNDYRLAPSTTLTLGLKYGLPLGSDSELAMRAELISQQVDNSGIPAGEETPDLNAIVLQLNYSLRW